jgi:hypothetical protein
MLYLLKISLSEVNQYGSFDNRILFITASFIFEARLLGQQLCQSIFSLLVEPVRGGGA